MAIPERIREYLDSHNVSYEPIHHPQAFASQEVAHAMHISGKRLAKAVVLEADGRLVMAVLLASYRLNLAELRSKLEVQHLKMVPEDTLTEVFPDCERGAIPPFGNLYDMDVWVDRAVAESEEVTLCAGTHVDCLHMKYSDFERLSKPQVGLFADVWVGKAA